MVLFNVSYFFVFLMFGLDIPFPFSYPPSKSFTHLSSCHQCAQWKGS